MNGLQLRKTERLKFEEDGLSEEEDTGILRGEKKSLWEKKMVAKVL
jgi:hypothetical protein